MGSIAIFSEKLVERDTETVANYVLFTGKWNYRFPLRQTNPECPPAERVKLLTRIRYDRPQLRVADNFRRELKAEDLKEQLPSKQRLSAMPSLPEAIAKPMHKFLDACGSVFDAESKLIERLSARNNELDLLRAAVMEAFACRNQAADEVIRASMILERSELRVLTRWVKLLESEAIRENRLCMLDVFFEDGLKAALIRAEGNAAETTRISKG